MRSKPFVSANFDNYSLPGGGGFDNFFEKMSKSPPYARPPPLPLGLDIDSCISKTTEILALLLCFLLIFTQTGFSTLKEGVWPTILSYSIIFTSNTAARW